MKTIRKLRMILSLFLVGLASVSFADTTLYLDGTSSGNRHFKTLYDALNYATGKYSTLGKVTILVSVNTTETKAITLSENDNITIVNRSGARHSINYAERPSTRMIAVVQNSILNIGKATDGNNAALIFRLCSSSESSQMEAGGKCLFKVVRGGVLNIYDNTEIGFGTMPIWITSTSSTTGRPVVNMYGGVIHSAKFACVHVQQGTFNMYGGYLVGHYNSSGSTIPNLSANAILSYSYVDNYFKNKYGVDKPILQELDITNLLKSYYEVSSVSDLNNGWAVYLHKNSNASGSIFNFYGGSICGFYCPGKRKIPTGYDGDNFTYYTIDGDEVQKSGTPVFGNRATINLLGGMVYCNRSGVDGGGVKITNDDFNISATNVSYNQGYVNMSAGCINYNESSSNGGGLRVEKGTLFTMTGGTINHNVTKKSEDSGSGGGGGVRMVSAKMVMSGDAEIAYNHSTGDIEKYNGGGVAAVWQSSFGQAKSIVNLNGGRIHHNVAENNGGGVTATDKGNTGAVGIEMTFNGVEIDHNTSKTSGGGVYVGGSADIIIDKNPTTQVKTKIHDNLAYTNGGGLHVSSAVAGGHTGGVDASNCQVYNNMVNNGDGGGLYSEYAYVNIHDGAEFYNHNINGKGAGICIAARADYTQDGGFVRDNQANGNGGGFYVTGGNVTVIGGTIENNTTQSSGGGFCVDAGVVTINGNALIDHNSAAGNGGGFYVNTSNSSIITTVKGGAQMTYNTAQNGGGAYVNRGTLSIADAATTIANDTASIAGGGIYLGTGSVTITDASLSGNVSQSSHGGGFYVANGSFTANNASIDGNKAPNGNGGGVYAGGVNGYVTLNAGSTVTDNSAKNGGGICVDGGNLTFTDAVMTGNSATNDGGGFYTTGGDVQINGNSAMVSTNEAAVNGGGMYIGGDINLQGGNITMNTAGSRGGGVYVAEGGTFDMTGGAIGGTVAEGNTTGSGGYGGGLFMGGGTATIANGSISGNTATEGYGGGIYMEGGTCTLSGGANIGGESTTYANSARFGGGLYSAGGAITVQGGHIDYNNATADGGGIYSNGPEATVVITREGTEQSYLQYNTAINGGGIYANRGSVEFTDGNVDYNYASQAGGGMYVDDEGTLYMKGNANLSRNHVPEGKDGGGVYLKGTVVVGEQVSDPADLGVIQAEDNYAGAVYQYGEGLNNRNNIFLPAPQNPEVLTNHRDIITVIYNGISENSKVGFSVPRNYVPVIYCENNNVPCTETGYTDYTTSQRFLHKFSTGMELQHNLFDDTERYTAVHYVDKPGIFDPDHVYLYGFWTNIVTTNPVGTDTIGDIDTPEKLAYFITWVNGLNDRKLKGPRPNAYGNITADIDMSAYGWVPIGAVDTVNYADSPGFTGVINGNGHTITGISSLLNGHHKAYGIVGQLKGGTIVDLFVKDAQYALEYVDGLVIGGLAGDVTGDAVIANSEVSCSIMATHPNTIMGGLVGRTGKDDTEPTIHSSIGITDMTGFEMGGLIGRNVKGNLYNSFANAKFTSQNNNDKYMGGLVAVNRGTVENCYSRLRGTAPSGNFGILVGDNTDGEVNYCYAPAGMTNYKAAGAAPTGHGNYGDSFLPYLYRHRDTQVSLADDNDFVPSGEDVDKQMLIALNNWVNEMSTEDMAYTKWGRPWQESETNKPLNDDYPILKMPLNDAVAAKTGDPYLYYSPIDTLLVKYTAADEAIWMYRNNTLVRGKNVGSAAKLYIAEDVALIHNDTINAYVGITLDNSAGVNGAHPQGGVSSVIGIATDSTDWHMISTSLSNAPIGIAYDDVQYEFSFGHPTGMPYYRFYPKDSDRHGYFPSHRFHTDYPDTDTSIEEGGANYYTEWDFYSYDEPHYHWINFKRNKRSHWHMDDPEHSWQINYENESQMIPGKGYFAATREETFLQCYGTLNYAGVDDTIVTQTSGVPRHCYNLLGNPYQAYLDFKAFVEANVDDYDAIWNNPSTASYTIINEDEQGYQTFAYQSSYNPDDAGRFIHPHQGFFVLLRDRDRAKAHFEPVMRNASDTVISQFRGQEHLDYPLVNLFVSEANGNTDMVTVELGRPDEGGAPVMQALRTGNGKIWCHYNDEDWAIAFTQPGITEVGIRFESVEDTEYTLRWNTYNGEFSYLHIIDNMTGADVDCLSESEYKFSSSTSDYKSRFRLVFGYTDIEENDIEATEINFAFMMCDEMVVNGEGVLQVFDMNGRLVTSRELHGVQSTVALPEVANGVYVLRLTEGKQSRVQKMVISK